jgi:hypothetical protein
MNEEDDLHNPAVTEPRQESNRDITDMIKKVTDASMEN